MATKEEMEADIAANLHEIVRLRDMPDSEFIGVLQQRLAESKEEANALARDNLALINKLDENERIRMEASIRHSAQFAEAVSELKNRAEKAEDELSTVAHAAHMPADYKHGLPSWVNRLYLAYIGGQLSPEAMAEIAAGRLTFPDAPVYTALAAAQEALNAIEKELTKVDNEPLKNEEPYATVQLGRWALVDEVRAIINHRKEKKDDKDDKEEREGTDR